MAFRPIKIVTTRPIIRAEYTSLVVDNMQNLVEKRGSKRYLIRLKVIDRDTGELLGFAENINSQGMKIIIKKPIPGQRDTSAWLVKEDAKLRIPVWFCRIWSSFSNTEPVFYYAGVRFINPSEESLGGIQNLIDAENNKLF